MRALYEDFECKFFLFGVTKDDNLINEIMNSNIFSPMLEILLG